MKPVDPPVGPILSAENEPYGRVELPGEFAELEGFCAKWCLATEPERYRARLASPMAELSAFYDAAFPRLRDAMTHLDRFPFPGLPPAELNLLHLMYSLIAVSLPVEVWGQPRVLDSGTADFDRYLEPSP
jgi:hypothetical protein